MKEARERGDDVLVVETTPETRNPKPRTPEPRTSIENKPYNPNFEPWTKVARTVRFFRTRNPDPSTSLSLHSF